MSGEGGVSGWGGVIRVGCVDLLSTQRNTFLTTLTTPSISLNTTQPHTSLIFPPQVTHVQIKRRLAPALQLSLLTHNTTQFHTSPLSLSLVTHVQVKRRLAPARPRPNHHHAQPLGHQMPHPGGPERRAGTAPLPPPLCNNRPACPVCTGCATARPRIAVAITTPLPLPLLLLLLLLVLVLLGGVGALPALVAPQEGAAAGGGGLRVGKGKR